MTFPSNWVKLLVSLQINIPTDSELTYRGHPLDGFTPVKLLGEETEQLEMDFPEPPCGEHYPTKKTENENLHQLKQVTEERDRAQETASRYKQQLQEFEAFTQFLLLGRIFPAPITTNGLEKAPFLRVFGSPTTLDQLHNNFRILRAKHHPDSSPYQAQEAADRFHWLRQAYKMLVDNWVRFSPTNPDIPQERIDKLKAQKLQWDAESFWYW